MTYSNAILDQSIVPYPAIPPPLGPAGSLITDPFCGQSITRMTDERTDPARPGTPWSSDSSSESQVWAPDSSRFIVLDSKSNAKWLCEQGADGAWKVVKKVDGIQFSSTNRNMIWSASDLSVTLYSIDTGKSLTVVNFRDYPGLGIPATTPRWYVSSLSVDAADQRVACYLGPGQDTSEVVAVWDSQWGVSWLNTATGKWDGWNGQAGGTIDNWTPFKIHTTHISRGGHSVEVGPSGVAVQSQSFWEPGTAVFQFLTVQQAPILGHHAQGYSHYYGSTCKAHPFEFLQAPLFSLDTKWKYIYWPTKTPGFWNDYHISTIPDSADRWPIYISTYNTKNPNAPGAMPTAGAPGDNEIIAVATDGTGRWWRMGHHYSSARNGFYSTPRGNVSPDGKWFLFTSDWCSTLGGRTDCFLLTLQ